MFQDVFHTEARLVYHAVLLFAVGLFASAPVVRWRMRAVARPALVVLDTVTRALGVAPSIARTALTIWTFNATVIFIYMASGFHPLLPKLFCLWTGLNVGAVIGFARTGQYKPREPKRLASQWMPAYAEAAVCGLAMLVLELGCFWTSIAMGISLGTEVQSGLAYASALAPRAAAYATFIIPALLISAASEAVAVRAASEPVDADD
jgi:hypothetical protein